MCGPYGDEYPVVNIAQLASSVAFITAWFGWGAQLVVVSIAWIMHLALCCGKVGKIYMGILVVASLASAGISFYVANVLNGLFGRRELFFDFCFDILTLDACQDPKGRIIATQICGVFSIITAGADIAMIFTVKDDVGAEDEAVVAAIKEGSEEKDAAASEDV